MTKQAEMALTPVDPAVYDILDPQGESAQALRENLAGETLTAWDFTQIRVPAGGSRMWQIPTDDGISEEPIFDGVIVLSRSIRSWWQDEFSGKGTPPTCSSHDSLVGVGDIGDGRDSRSCLTCPLAQFGSGKNSRSQACKQSRLLFVVQPHSFLPTVVVVPPSSLKLVKQYMLQLGGRKISHYATVTRFSLNPTQNADGIKYSEIRLANVAPLTTEQAAAMRDYGQQLDLSLADAGGTVLTDIVREVD